jgi:hypothetical protein
MRLAHLFSTEELEKLDQKQLDILNDLLLHEVRTSPEIRDLLHSKLRPVYARWTSDGRPRRPRGTATRRPRGQGKTR